MSKSLLEMAAEEPVKFSYDWLRCRKWKEEVTAGIRLMDEKEFKREDAYKWVVEKAKIDDTSRSFYRAFRTAAIQFKSLNEAK